MAHRPRNRRPGTPFTAVIATLDHRPASPAVDADAIRAKHCGTKIAYGPQVAHDVVARRNAKMTKLTYSAYRCVFCSSWHIGHIASVIWLEKLAAVLRMESA